MSGAAQEKIPNKESWRCRTLWKRWPNGTAMPSFADAYGGAQRWDVAFFVMTLRVGFAPARPRPGERFGLDELAASSNADLLARLHAGRPDATPEEVDALASPPAGDGRS